MARLTLIVLLAFAASLSGCGRGKTVNSSAPAAPKIESRPYSQPSKTTQATAVPLSPDQRPQQDKEKAAAQDKPEMPAQGTTELPTQKSTPATTSNPPPARRVLLLPPGGPLIVEIRITIDGRPHSEVFNAALNSVLAAADTDQDGRATWSELYKNPAILEQLKTGPARMAAREINDSIQRFDTNRDGQLQTSEAASWLGRDSGFRATPFSVRSSRSYRPMPHLGSHVWQLLDQNNDRQLSADELNSSAARLSTLDENDDRTVSAAETSPLDERLQSADRAQSSGGIQKGEYAALDLSEETDPSRLSYLLSALYAGGRELTPGSFPEAQAFFRELDEDGDGVLDEDDLAKLRSAEPHLAIELAFKSGDVPKFSVITRRLRETPPEIILNSARGSDRVAIASGSTELRISSHDLRQLASGRKNKLQSSSAQIALIVHDNCDALFAALDQNFDNRLGERELANSAGRLLSFDRDGNGVIEVNELRNALLVAFVLGDEAAGKSLNVPDLAASTGPASVKWFLDSDLNGDGDISKLEFYSTQEQFQRLDANSDNFISRDEAERIPLE